jgi:hypothetical protein
MLDLSRPDGVCDAVPMSDDDKKDTLARIQSLSTIFSLIAVPIIVAITGGMIQRGIQTSDARTKSLGLAIDILKEPPSNRQQPGLREWAIETLQASSGVKLSDAALRELKLKPLLPVQPVQRTFTSGGWSYLVLGKQQEILTHKITLTAMRDDTASMTVDGNQVSIEINDSAVLPPDGCVIHVLGFSLKGDPDDPNYESHKEQAKKTNTPQSTFVAYVCP